MHVGAFATSHTICCDARTQRTHTFINSKNEPPTDVRPFVSVYAQNMLRFSRTGSYFTWICIVRLWCWFFHGTANDNKIIKIADCRRRGRCRRCLVQPHLLIDILLFDIFSWAQSQCIEIDLLPPKSNSAIVRNLSATHSSSLLRRRLFLSLNFLSNCTIINRKRKYILLSSLCHCHCIFAYVWQIFALFRTTLVVEQQTQRAVHRTRIRKCEQIVSFRLFHCVFDRTCLPSIHRTHTHTRATP